MSRASSPAQSRAAQELSDNDDIDIEQLIALMHRKPPLWDKFDPKYHDRILKARLWEEIYQEMYFTWEQCSVAEKKQKGTDVQKKWKNLKDTYFKEVAADKKVVSDQAARKKKRPYIHKGALSFLATQKSMRDTTNNIKDTESTNSNTEELTNQSDDDTDTETSRNRKLKASMRKKTKEKIKIQNNSDDELLKLLQDKNYDEDVSFCEMIIPMLKNLSTDQKHYAKIEILNALNRATKYSPQNCMPPRVRSALSQYQSSSSSSYSSYNQYPPSFPQTPPDPSPQTQYMPSPTATVIPQSPPDTSPQTQLTQSYNTTVIPQSPPDPSSPETHSLSLRSNFPNTPFNHSSYVVEGSGFDMKDYVLFK